jgi:type 1 glutamine amidotransferase
MRLLSIFSATFALSAAFAAVACSSGTSLDDLNQNPGPSGGGTSSTAGTGTGTAGTTPAAGTGSVDPTGGSGGSAAPTGGTAPVGGSSGSVAGSAPVGGTGSGGTGGDAPVAGTTSMGGGGSGGSGGGTTEPPGPYSDRTGAFEMLVLTRTAAFRHTAAIDTGKTMLSEIGAAQNFKLTFADTDAEIDQVITATGLAKFEIIFHLNTTGDIFDAAQQQTYQTWMETKGAFAGVHAATDTENGWAFYSEVTGQYYNGHGAAGTQGQIQFDASALDFPAVKGLPNPWSRAEEWYNFNSYQQWSVKPGFKVLGRKAADQQPIVWTREYNNFRAFYSAIGHDAAVFRDPDVKKHLTGGIMWAVRREKLIK